MTVDSVLVVGATGTQGGAVVDHLLAGEAGDVDVHAMTRHAGSDEAILLESRGVRVVEGDLTHKNKIRPLVEAVDGVFLVTTPFEQGVETEVEQGVNMAEVAAEVGVDHLVFSSVGGADRETGIPHFDSKYRIEERIDELDLPATVVRPVYFTTNFERQRQAILNGELAMGLSEGVPLQLVAPDDIGAFVARAFADPDRYVGQAYELAGDEQTVESAAAVFSDVTGVDVEPVHVPVETLRAEQGEEIAVMFEWFDEHGYDADVEALAREHDLSLTTLREYLHEHDWAQ